MKQKAPITHPIIKPSLIILGLCIISTIIIVGIYEAPHFLNWGIKYGIPAYTYEDMDKPLRSNQYVLSGEYITANEKYVYLFIDGTTDQDNKTWIQIEKTDPRKEGRDYKLCYHSDKTEDRPGDNVSYAAFAEETGDMYIKFTLRRELC